jgi:hypothetical protein
MDTTFRKLLTGDYELPVQNAQLCYKGALVGEGFALIRKSQEAYSVRCFGSLKPFSEPQCDVLTSEDWILTGDFLDWRVEVKSHQVHLPMSLFVYDGMPWESCYEADFIRFSRNPYDHVRATPPVAVAFIPKIDRSIWTHSTKTVVQRFDYSLPGASRDCLEMHVGDTRFRLTEGDSLFLITVKLNDHAVNYF